MKLLIKILACFLLSISLQAETYLSSILYYGSYEFDQTIAYDNILILRSSSIFIYENGNLLNYFDESLLRTVDKSSRFYSFKYDKLNRRLVFCSDSGMVTYNIDNEEVKFVKTGFRVYFFDVYNSTAMISSGNDFVWWDLDKGLIKREKKGITGEIMFRMIDSERFILYHAQAAYLYSAGHYDKLFDGVEQLLHRYEEIQIYNDYLLYKPFRQNTVVFNMITKSQEAELDNKYQSWNLLSFKDDKVYYGNNDARLCSYNLNSKITNINSSVFARYLWGCDGIIFYDFLNKILRFNDDTKVSKQVVRNITENIADNLELLQDYIVIHQREPLLEVLNKQGEAILDGMIVLANNNSYALGDANTIYYQNLENQLIIVDLDQHKTNVIQELDFEVDQLYYQDGTLYYLYNDKLYKYKDNNQFEVFKNITDCYKVELIENSSIYYFSNANNEGDDMYLNMLDLNSNVIVCDSVPVSKYASYRKSFLKMQDTIYLREYNKLRYINPNTLETVRKIKWKDNIRFEGIAKYQDEILLCTQRKITGISDKVEEIYYQSKNVSLGTNLVNLAVDGNICYMLDDRGIIYYEDITPTSIWEDREEVHGIELADYITVYDMQGKKMGDFNSYSVCIDNLQRGKYILEYTISNKKYVKQIIRL